MRQHTPGPWPVCEPVSEMDGDRKWTAELLREMWWVGRRPGAAIALIDGSADWREEAEANARLIAAAPDLLAACEAAFDWLSRFGEHAPIVFGGEAELSEQLRFAIAKARGAERTKDDDND